MTDTRVALVTGANKGLGFEIARQLGQKGIAVVIGARDADKGTPAVAKLRSEGLDAHYVQLDVTNDADVRALPGFFSSKFGRLDILVNNAGIALWTEGGVEAFRKTFEVNVFGLVAVTEALLPLLKSSPAGRIVHQSSFLGSLGSIENAQGSVADFINPAYTSSKAAVNGYTVALAVKTRGTALKVNAAHPGWVKTDLGGDEAPMEIVDGAKTAVRLATLDASGPSGKLIHFGDVLPW
jgi:NAD(P)-dependent dehydrogenase (short-subunit alcohol dehydrogenase family)